MSSMGWLTAFMNDTTISFVKDGALREPTQLDMGNSGLSELSKILPLR